MLQIIESYDGRLPEYRVVNTDLKTLKIFDSHEEAQKWCNEQLEAPCGEEIP